MLRDAERDPVEPDALEPLLPRLGEPVPRLGAVADDREAPRRAAQQQHLPLRVGQLLRLVDDDVRERPGQRVGVGGRQRGVVDQGVLRRSCPRSIDISIMLGVVGCDQVVDDLGHALALGGEGRFAAALSRRDASGSPSRWRAASRSGRSEAVQAGRSRRCSIRTSSGSSQGAHRRR